MSSKSIGSQPAQLAEQYKSDHLNELEKIVRLAIIDADHATAENAMTCVQLYHSSRNPDALHRACQHVWGSNPPSQIIVTDGWKYQLRSFSGLSTPSTNVELENPSLSLKLYRLAQRIEEVRKNSRLPQYLQSELTEVKCELRNIAESLTPR